MLYQAELHAELHAERGGIRTRDPEGRIPGLRTGPPLLEAELPRDQGRRGAFGTGLEPATSRIQARVLYQLSYLIGLLW